MDSQAWLTTEFTIPFNRNQKAYERDQAPCLHRAVPRRHPWLPQLTPPDPWAPNSFTSQTQPSFYALAVPQHANRAAECLSVILKIQGNREV